MAIQFSVSVRNAQLDALETTIGASPQLRFYTGSIPANCAAAATGTLLATLTLPSDSMANAASGTKAKSGTWSGTGSAAGSAGYYREYDSTGTTCHVQGTITATGGGGDLTMDNVVIASAQAITVNSFTLAAGNA